MADEPDPAEPGGSTTTVTSASGPPPTLVYSNGHSEKNIVFGTLAVVVVLATLGLVGIGIFSVYLRMIVDAKGHFVPQEAGASVGAVRENLMGIIGPVIGAFITAYVMQKSKP